MKHCHPAVFFHAWLLAWIFFFCATAFAQISKQPVRFLYQPLALGDLGGGESRATSINNQDWVAGESMNADGHTVAFVWNPADGIRALGTLGGTTSRAFDMNDRGVIVGEADDSNEVTRAFCWTPESGMLPLPHPADAFFSSALAVNESGQIIGTIEDANGSHTVLWQDNELIFLQRLPGAGHVQPLSVNTRGDVVGQVGVGLEDDPSVSLAFYFPQALAAKSLSDFKLVSALSGSSVVSINEEGLAAGYVMVESSRVRAFQYQPTGELELLDDRSALFSSASDINEAGWIAGSMIPGYAADEGACMWRHGRLYDLNEITDSADGWWFVQASGINKKGSITGHGIINDKNKAFLLRLVEGADMEAWPQPGIRVREATSDDRGARSILLEAVVPDGIAVKRVSFFQDGVALGHIDETPYEWAWDGSRDDECSVYIEVIEEHGRRTRSPRQKIPVNREGD